jgi:hypothetical protein
MADGGASGGWVKGERADQSESRWIKVISFGFATRMALGIGLLLVKVAKRNIVEAASHPIKAIKVICRNRRGSAVSMSATSRFDALRLLKALSLSKGNPGIGACWNSSGANPIKAIKVILAVLMAEGLAVDPTGSNPIF